jgi:hypothetical protein
MGATNSINKVIKLANYTLLTLQIKLLFRGSVSEGFFKLRDLAEQRCLNDEVNNVACTAYAVLLAKDKIIGVFVDSLNKFVVVVSCIIAYKTVQLWFKVILADNVKDCQGLRAASIVTKQVAESDKYVLLVVCGINKVSNYT